MKNFTKLALVSSIAFSANAMAMQAMDDAALSSTTGQDGINIGIGISKIEIEKLFIHDNDGLTDTAKGGTSTAGAIVIQGNKKAGDPLENKGIVIGANYDNGGAYLLASRNLADLRIDTDAGTGANGAFINIAADVSGLDIKIGEIGVTASGTAGTTGIRRGGDDNNYNAILSGLSLKTGPMTANVQLGAAPQGAMIKLSTTMVGGLEIKDLGILDASTKTATREAGEIFIESIKVADANKTDLTINQDVRVYGKEGTNNGYIQMVSNSGPIDNYVKGIHLGSKDAGSIGDIEVQGLQTFYSPAMGVYNQGSVITISSK
ncbi:MULTISPECIES: DUF6160 family protein [Acinetobacter]|uniref:putative pilus system protein FilA n=1 Tax=Acinetobacter TaxID=469 RepID=UPI00099285C9|nr:MULTISPECIES: DUF6160 family protein [Acinetobacter]MCL6232537.1 pilus assembly protein FilA [Acinetobacter amyesii]MCL6235482.1 pilus assembly protein FilA [Acinetobacter amyesii]MCL6244722.1 pilus assembly protein FilA [Acinetobacter amyesii]OOV84329.1 pilus assembly protein FilA [Acinetobacter sp. ANC 5600]QOW48839.1 pilus assembly protein FilA [Acinetobacter sp. YH12138]